MQTIRSIWVWFISTVVILLWFPTVCLVWLLDRDPLKYKTGWWFRTLAATLVRVNPAWKLHWHGFNGIDRSRTYVVVANHQSLADVPFLSFLPWEMKWMAKEELFKLPVAGWMMRMARDIPVDRQDRRSGAQALVRALKYLRAGVSVFFFPEGTRSTDRRVGRFNEGAFGMALKAGVPILPIAVEGSSDCLPKHDWKFGEPSDIHITILPVVETSSYSKKDAVLLRDRVRTMIVEEVARLRNVPSVEVDAVAAEPDPVKSS